jgi:serine phosphatase RsbU (regulator of sigma subunit)
LPRSTSTQGLLALTSALAGAGDPAEILGVMTRACPALLGAGLVNISLLQAGGQQLRLVSSLNTPSDVAEEFATYSVDAPLPTRDALRTGSAVVLRSVAERDERYPALAGVDVGKSAFCVVPLLSGVRPVGTLGLGWDEPDELTDDVLALCDAVAVVCANALHRSLAAGEEAAARRRSDSALARLRALQDVAADLAHTVDLPHAVSIVLERVVATLGAEAASFNLLDEKSGTCTQVATIGLDRSAISTWESWRIRDSSLAQELLRTGLPILVTDAAARRARFPDLGDDSIEQESWATLLLTSGETPLGMMAFGWREPRTFDLDDVALLQSLADHLAAAVDRANLLAANAALLEERTRVAETLQRSLLPAPLPTWPGITIAAGHEPAELGTEVCGDFYDAFLDQDGALIVVIGDVAGRGVAAAGLTGMARHTLRALGRDLPPPEALRRLNDALVDTTTDDEPRLLTAASLRLARTGTGLRADIALAGHCRPILVRQREARTVGEPGTMLGAVLHGRVGTASLDLEVGDVLLLHTDGVVEARRHGAEFGEARLLRLLTAMTDPQPAETVEGILNAVRWYRTTAPDDIAVVALRVEA